MVIKWEKKALKDFKRWEGENPKIAKKILEFEHKNILKKGEASKKIVLLSIKYW